MDRLLASLPVIGLLIATIAIANWIRVFTGEFTGGQIWLAILPTAFIVLPMVYGYLKTKIVKIPCCKVDDMTGKQFELFCKSLLEINGWCKIKTTPVNNDFGADLVGISPQGERVVIQCKRYKGNVSNSSVQQAVAAKNMYHCTRAAVMTNSFFTKNATELAQSNNVMLFDRNALNQMAKEVMEEAS